LSTSPKLQPLECHLISTSSAFPKNERRENDKK
jgi:hypothetical protein